MPSSHRGQCTGYPWCYDSILQLLVCHMTDTNVPSEQRTISLHYNQRHGLHYSSIQHSTDAIHMAHTLTS
uniref:Uncharacterized protein n=1 Tax=Anguilla anguilla TaxID=7936 RepID=A0A0E9X5D0_ANGAN